MDASLEQFVSEERKRICDEDNSKTLDLKTVPDQKCITHFPTIKRGRDYTSYYRTSGTNLSLKRQIIELWKLYS